MRTLIFLLAIATTSCAKYSFTNGTVVKDCTGSYLRVNNLDYLICNDSTVKNIPDQTNISVKYKKGDNCTAPGLCLIAHPTEGTIQILEITQ